MMIVLTNGRVAWPMGGYIGDRYYDQVYLPPDGWVVKLFNYPVRHCVIEDSGLYRFKKGHTFKVEVNHG